MDFLKVSIIINLIFLIVIILILLGKLIFYIRNLIISNILKNLKIKILLKNFFVNNKIIISIMFISLILAILRTLFVDPQIIVTDNYDYYANQIMILFNDWTYDIDTQLIQPGTIGSQYLHKYRIVYSLIIAIIGAIFPKMNIVFIGKAISYISFLISLLLIKKILKNYEGIYSEKNIQKILIIFVLNPTMLANSIRFETDILFLVLSFFVIYLYLKFVNSKANIIDFILLVISSVLLFFTREVGALLIAAILLHFIINQNTKIKLSLVGLVLISVIILSITGFFKTLLFYVIWSATGHDIAFDIVYNLSFLSFSEKFIAKFTNIEVITKTIESFVYAFVPSALFGFLGYINLYNKSKNKRKLFRNLFSIYFVIFIFVYFVIKIGRGLDRFWIPIILFPIILLPFCNDFKTMIFNLKNNFIKTINKISMKIAKKPVYQNTDIESFNSNNNQLNISDDIVLVTISIQLLIYIIRFSLALFDLSISG